MKSKILSKDYYNLSYKIFMIKYFFNLVNNQIMITYKKDPVTSKTVI